MARTGLFYGLLELIRPGQKVIMSPLTIIDVVNMVILAGGTPVFADVRRHSCSIDPEQVRHLIDNQTGAVLITHLHGESAGALEFRDICRDRGIALIEDAAQAFGAMESGRRLGTIGHLGVFSTGFYKNLNSWRGGIVVSDDENVISAIRRRVNDLPLLTKRRLLGVLAQGFLTESATWPPVFARLTYPFLRWNFLHGITALNSRLDPERKAKRLFTMPADFLYRMTASQADLARHQMERVDTDTHARIRKASRYESALAPINDLTVSRANGLSNIFTYYPIQYSDRERLLKYATRQKRDFAAQYLRNCADLPEFAEFYRDCPNARRAARELILLPTYPHYPDSEIQKNIEVIRRFLGVSSKGTMGFSSNRQS
jgi:dTDP-4-amino-4,6-dideoxygalactose transaminase